jgi:hypothetical protein
MQVNDYNKDYIDVTYQGNEYLLTQVDMTTYINSDFYGVVEIHSLVAHICPEYGDDIRVMVDDKFIEQLEKELVEWMDWEEVSNQQYWNRIESLFPDDDVLDDEYE